jgi:hypothetical protein
MKKPQKPKTKKVRLYNGRTVEVNESDYEDYIAFQRADSHLPGIEDYLEDTLYIYEGGKMKDRPPSHQVTGCGHIAWLKYYARRQVMVVGFVVGGAEVMYFQVPNTVYSELVHFAESGQTDASGRHVLGIRFWDMVRIRGQKRGSRYIFKYVVDNYTSVAERGPLGPGLDETMGINPKNLDYTEQRAREMKRLGSNLDDYTPAVQAKIKQILSDNALSDDDKFKKVQQIKDYYDTKSPWVQKRDEKEKVIEEVEDALEYYKTPNAAFAKWLKTKPAKYQEYWHKQQAAMEKAAKDKAERAAYMAEKKQTTKERAIERERLRQGHLKSGWITKRMEETKQRLSERFKLPPDDRSLPNGNRSLK